ncbi:MAG: hypothetical protein LBJ11_09400 [Oscillospiraceae bacterium]|jgi:cell division septum initiation protein DivIVA|nr:hypothetical protein [Oscillospiraceae bacterium]
MKEEYLPNEKYRNMFGVERNGYGMERVDLYLAQLEVAFKKFREENRNLKRELAEQQQQSVLPMPQRDAESAMLLSEQQELNRGLRGKLVEQEDYSTRLRAQNEELLNENAMLRQETEDLKLRARQPAPMTGGMGVPGVPADARPDEMQQLIAKVLIDARASAEETVRSARSEADQMLRKARHRVEELRAEQERVRNHLQGMCYSLNNLLREAEEPDRKRGEEFAV